MINLDQSVIVAIVLVLSAGLAFELGISSAILEILAGVAIAMYIGDIAQMGWLTFLANLGMLGLMFMAGFEVDVERLRGTWRRSVSIGVSSLALPMAGVYLTARYGLGIPPKAAGLLAIGLSTTSLALVFHSLKDRGLLHKPPGQTLLAAASVVDVLSMVCLALLLGEVGWGTAIVLLVLIPAMAGLPHVGAWIFKRYKGSVVELEIRFLLVVLVGLGSLAEHIGGIHPAVVAFAVGLVLSELVEEHEAVEEKLKGIVFSFLAPIFFLQAGTQLNLRLLGWEMLGTAAILFVVACGLKFIGTALSARGLIDTSGRFAGLLFNYRLSFGIIAASVGLKIGLLTPSLYSVILLVVIASAALPVIFLRDRPAELDW